MKIGISLDSYMRSTDIITGVQKLAELGFEAIDFNFSDYSYPDSIFAKDNWREVVENIKAVADKSGIVFSQLHSPFYMIIDNHEHDEFEAMMMERSFAVCQILGAKWAVIHQKRFSEGLNEANYNQTKSYNIERIQRLCKTAAEYDIGIAVENFFRFPEELKNQGINQVSDLIDTIDQSNCANLGICLDTGHAFFDGINPSDAVNAFGKRLKVLHIHDNDGRNDLHIAPFTGRIDWEQFMNSLNKSEFAGVFSLEIHNFVQRMPKELIDDAVRLSFKIAKYLVH